ncbi:hypothetical protein CI102_5702 [Trichoderma harzianum]|nr:hypothetical protein CI102_5702 [Trichoderma harzianum]
MKSAMETGNMTQNGLMEHCAFGLDLDYWDESLASLFVCGKKESAATVLLCVCCFLCCCCCCCCFGSLVCFFLFSSGDGCSAYFLLSVSIPVVF